jgi:hypothetical protein
MADVHLRVYVDKSELVYSDGRIEIFLEGASSAEARQRYRTIEKALSDGYLNRQIEVCKTQEASTLGFASLSEDDVVVLDNLVGSITSEVGRALVALTVMQLCIKSIEPSQSIRLHKGGERSSGFSWREGISMRTLDSNYITPVLRAHNLLLLNSYGLFMTRTLAENYPYSRVYKAQMRGGRNQWLEIVERIENGSLPPEVSLRYMLSQLINRAEQFRLLSESMLQNADVFLAKADVTAIIQVIVEHIHQSDYAARLMEIAMHSLMQAVWELDTLAGGEVVPLSQMRSANKKHGNIADVEIRRDGQIVEAWDAKYGKSYLRDEIEELADKLPTHLDVGLVGFVTSGNPERLPELAPRMQEIELLFGITLRIVSLADWVQMQFNRVTSEGMGSVQEVAGRWLVAYGESLAQRRRPLAPIDEPCQRWVETLQEIIIDHANSG